MTLWHSRKSRLTSSCSFFLRLLNPVNLTRRQWLRWSNAQISRSSLTVDMQSRWLGSNTVLQCSLKEFKGWLAFSSAPSRALHWCGSQSSVWLSRTRQQERLHRSVSFLRMKLSSSTSKWLNVWTTKLHSRTMTCLTSTLTTLKASRRLSHASISLPFWSHSSFWPSSRLHFRRYFSRRLRRNSTSYAGWSTHFESPTGRWSDLYQLRSSQLSSRSSKNASNVQ